MTENNDEAIAVFSFGGIHEFVGTTHLTNTDAPGKSQAPSDRSHVQRSFRPLSAFSSPWSDGSIPQSGGSQKVRGRVG